MNRLSRLRPQEARRAVIQGSAEDFGHANDLAALFVGPSALLLLDGEKHAAARRSQQSSLGQPAPQRRLRTSSGIALLGPFPGPYCTRSTRRSAGARSSTRRTMAAVSVLSSKVAKAAPTHRR